MDGLLRGQTEKLMKAQQKTPPSVLACTIVVYLSASIGLGIWWLCASNATSPTPPGFNATAGVNATVAGGDAAWSKWYLGQGIIVLVFGLLWALSFLAQSIMSCDPHVAKAALYKKAGRTDDAAAEEQEEGAFVRMCQSLYGLTHCLQCCLGLIPTYWCCVGFFMFFFGFSLFGVYPQSKLWNEDSKWYIIISCGTCGAGCCVFCAVGSFASVVGKMSGVATSGSEVDEESGNEELE